MSLTEAEIREIREACNRLTPYHDVNRRDGFYDLAEKALPRLLDERETLLAIVRELVSIPAVKQVLGTWHTKNCECPMCRALDYLASHKGDNL